MTNPRVLVIGDANVDMIIRRPNRDIESSEAVGTNPQLHGGGSAANTAVALARLGVEVGFVGALGDDGYGRWILEDFEREGVDARAVTIEKGAHTPMVMAVIEPDGERFVMVWPPEGGAHFQLRSNAIELSFLDNADWLHTTGMCLRASPACDTILYAMELAGAKDLTVSLDLNLRLESWGLDDVTKGVFDRAIELSDVVFGNAVEEIIPLMAISEVEQAALQMSDGKRVVIARQGNQGAIVASNGEAYHVPAFHTEVVDTLGAGDAFNAGFIAARIDDHGVMDATKWGHAVAAHKIARVGARATPTKTELGRLLQTSRITGR